jgi:hypothetical protein
MYWNRSSFDVETYSNLLQCGLQKIPLHIKGAYQDSEFGGFSAM